MPSILSILFHCVFQDILLNNISYHILNIYSHSGIRKLNKIFLVDKLKGIQDMNDTMSLTIIFMLLFYTHGFILCYLHFLLIMHSNWLWKNKYWCLYYFLIYVLLFLIHEINKQDIFTVKPYTFFFLCC